MKAGMSEVRSCGRRLRAALLGPLVVLALAAPASAAQSGHLDREFGHRGKLTIATKLLGPQVESMFPLDAKRLETKLLPAGKGRFLLANRSRIFRFEKDGRLDPKFGQGGYVTIAAPSGQLLTPTDIAFDSSGRILVAAEARDADSQPERTPGLNEYGFELHGPPLTRAAVMRLLPNGQADTSFGNGGVVESTVNAPPPSFQGRSYQTPSVRGLAIASDSQGRPVLAGSFVSESLDCYPFTFMHFATKAFVARFGTGGTLESVSTDPAAAASGAGVALLRVGGERTLLERYDPVTCRRGGPENDPSVIALLDSAGAEEAGFPPATVSFAGAPGLAHDARGRVVLAGQKEVGSGGLAYFATRLRANGSLDIRFGRGGELPLRRATGPLEQIAVDANNRPIFPGGLEGRGGLALNRLTARGQLDGRFGKRGVVQIPFAAAEVGSASAATVDGAGRIVVAGSLSTSSSPESAEFIGVARYIPGR